MACVGFMRRFFTFFLSCFVVGSVGQVFAVGDTVAQNPFVNVPEGYIYDMSEVQSPAEFPGGKIECSKFINQNLVFPQEAVDKGLNGKVSVRFVVNTDGSLSDIEVIKASDSSFVDEAIRVVKSMPKWTPGQVAGKPVPSYSKVSLTFKQ